MADKTILIVDDEPAIRSLLKCAVSAPGIRIVEANSAIDALALADGDGPFELVVTDVLMPGMDGVEMAERLRSGKRAQHFLFVSGYYDGDEMQARIATFDSSAAFLAKPFGIPELLRVVHQLLEPVRSAEVRVKARRALLRRQPTLAGQVAWARRRSARLRIRQRELYSELVSAHWMQALLQREAAAHIEAIQSVRG